MADDDEVVFLRQTDPKRSRLGVVKPKIEPQPQATDQTLYQQQQKQINDLTTLVGTLSDKLDRFMSTAPKRNKRKSEEVAAPAAVPTLIKSEEVAAPAADDECDPERTDSEAEDTPTLIKREKAVASAAAAPPPVDAEPAADAAQPANETLEDLLKAADLQKRVELYETACTLRKRHNELQHKLHCARKASYQYDTYLGNVTNDANAAEANYFAALKTLRDHERTKKIPPCWFNTWSVQYFLVLLNAQLVEFRDKNPTTFRTFENYEKVIDSFCKQWFLKNKDELMPGGKVFKNLTTDKAVKAKNALAWWPTAEDAEEAAGAD